METWDVLKVKYMMETSGTLWVSLKITESVNCRHTGKEHFEWN
jgi:hypothetical protein